MTHNELTIWQSYLVGKPCPKHPLNTIKDGKYGLWCGYKDFKGYCDGGWPTDEWLDQHRKETHVV